MNLKRILNFTVGIMLASALNVFAQKDEQIAYELENLESLNTRFSEFGAVPFEQGVVLVSKRGQASNAQLNRWLGGSFFDIYSGIKNDESAQDSYLVSEISSDINSKFHDELVSYDPTGQILYFTRSNKTPFVDENSGVQIFRLSIHYSKYENGTWSDIQNFPFNERKYSVGHPAVSRDGQRMFFVSDKAGGFGGTDIYLTERKDGEWSEPANVGDQINTSRDEMFPFYHTSGRLYFASKGRGGLGGLDVYESKYANGEWSEAKNMGNPINGSRDDFALYINEDFTEGLLSSNRIGGSGSDDIYRVFVYDNSYINEPDEVVATDVEEVLEDAESRVKENVGGDVGNGMKKSEEQSPKEEVEIPRTNYKYQAPKQQHKTDNSTIPVETIKNEDLQLKESDAVASSANATPKPSGDELTITSITIAKEKSDLNVEKVAYRIQLGAYSSSKKHLFEHLNDLESLDEYKEAGLFKYLVGYYKDLETVEAVVQEIRERGVPDAFIVGFQDGHKISKEEAQEYLD